MSWPRSATRIKGDSRAGGAGTLAPLLVAAGHRRRRDRGGVGRLHAQARGAGDLLPFGCHEIGLAGELRQGRDEPAGRHPEAAAAQVSAGEGQHPPGRCRGACGGTGQGSQELPVLVVDPLAKRGKDAVGQLASSVGEQRVVSGAGREQPFGHPDHVHGVEVLTDAVGDRSHVHADAAASDPVQVGVEFELDQVAERLQRDRRAEGVQARQRPDDSIDQVPGAKFLVRQVLQVVSAQDFPPETAPRTSPADAHDSAEASASNLPRRSSTNAFNASASPAARS